MLRALKWAYDLGIRHERVRIASHLQVRASHLLDSRDTALSMLSNNADLKRPNKNTAKKLEFKIAVEDQVRDLIHEMFTDNGHYVSGASIMFPDDEHKGPVK
jgi:hypothetical protein